MKTKAKKIITDVLFIIVLILIVLGSYSLGREHGNNQSKAQYYLTDCENKIYPYGCKLDKNSTHCFIFNCPNENFAFCKEINNLTDTGFYENIIINTLGLKMFGCTIDLEEIGINPITGNENWFIK